MTTSKEESQLGIGGINLNISRTITHIIDLGETELEYPRSEDITYIMMIIDLGETELEYPRSEDITYIMVIGLGKLKFKEISHKESILETCIFLSTLIIIDYG